MDTSERAEVRSLWLVKWIVNATELRDIKDRYVLSGDMFRL